tara:strand:- start:799 stop:1887 length:1089 start_codon:yes stop_codon:yes gene_type:complete
MEYYLSDIEMIFKQIKNRKLLPNDLDNSDVNIFESYMKDTQNIKIFNNFVELMNKISVNIFNIAIDSSGKDILMSYYIFFFSSIFLEDTKSNENIIKDCKELVSAIENSYKQINIENIEKLCINLSKISKNLNEWREKDKQNLISNLKNQYYELQVYLSNLDSNNLSEKEKKNLNDKKIEILNKIKDIGGEKEVDELKKTVPVIFDTSAIEGISEQIRNNMKKAYKDIFSDEIKNGKFDILLNNLKEVKEQFLDLVSNSTQFKNEINEIMDIEFIEQLIKNNALEDTYIYSITNYIIELIRKLESPSEDKDTDKWKIENIEIFNNHIEYSEYFPLFFEKTASKINTIYEQKKQFYENIRRKT